MKPYLLLLLSLASLSAFSQKNSIINEYDKLFSLNVYEENGKFYHNLKINEIEPSHPLSGLINDNKLYVDYIYTNYTSISKEKIKELATVLDSAKRNQEFLSLLKADDLFNKYFSSMVKYYLDSKSNEYTYKATFNKKDTIALDSLVAIATHFFYLNRITPRGCHWAVCVGKNGYKNSGKTDSSPLIEAFCFNAVLGNIFNEEYQYGQEYDSIKKALNPVNFEGTQEEKIEKMRIAMYKGMQNSESLRKMLRVEYLKMSEKLSFILID
jgi:hypothetical protein